MVRRVKKHGLIRGLIRDQEAVGHRDAARARHVLRDDGRLAGQEALQMAREEAPGAQWVEGPRLARQSEEQRMRKAGAPELFNLPSPKKTAQRRPKR